MIYHDLNPVILHIWGPFSINWYSLSYVLGIVLGWNYLIHLTKKYKLDISKKFCDELITYAILGIIIGGRLGYVIFYDLEQNLQDPINILKTWNGGMSAHGGMIGLTLSLYIGAKKYKSSFFTVTDLVSCAAPIGLFFGRIANFINGELYGRATDVPWAVIFPSGGNIARHPSQIYEALLEGLTIFIIQHILVSKTKIIQKQGMVSAIFLIQYATFRFIVEFFRQPDEHIGFIGIFSLGQLLCLPLFVMAFIVIRLSQKKQSLAS